MIPPRVLSLAVFSASVMIAVWWWKQRQPRNAPLTKREVPWIDV
jgi:hypothetical protein